MIVRPLTLEDDEQSWRLVLLAFGGDRNEPPPDTWSQRPGRMVGAVDDRGRLLGQVAVLPYEQWWGGRPVVMAGVAGVAVHPDARGQGLVRRMLDQALEDEPISVLYPTAPGIYRPLGWEVVGDLDRTPIPLSCLPAPSGTVRSADSNDLPALAELYAARGRGGSGLLTRTGDCFPKGVAGLLEHDVVSVVVEDGEVTGYLAYGRGDGYDGSAELTVWDCVAATPSALRALLGSLRQWSAVAGTALWRGPTQAISQVIGARLPPARTTQPWMLRVLDPVAAVAARGFAAVSQDASFSLEGTGYRLTVADGRGQLSPVQDRDLPRLSPQGMALLYAGCGWGLHATGHASRPVPELEAAFAGPPPEILDYF